MARPKTDRVIQSINFEGAVLERLKERCKREKVQVSTYVNQVIKSLVMSEYEFYRQLAKQHNAEFQKAKMLMETARDKPE